MALGPSAKSIVAVLVSIIVLSGCTQRSSDAQAAIPTSADSTTTEPPSTESPPTTGLESLRDYRSKNYRNERRWLCLPGRVDPCSGELTVSDVKPNGVSEAPLAAEPAPDDIDCFYVYPTVSLDPGLISDWDASPKEEGYVARQQITPLKSQCRIYAPIYRQRTLEAIAVGAGPDTEAATDQDPYDDILDAWRTYLSKHNGGRGVILVGHSQGSAMLIRLIAEEIESNPDQAALLVAAYLPGMSVQVPPDGIVGGTFASTPLCQTTSDTGCVVTWSSYRAEVAPGVRGIFGRDRNGTVAACNPPTSLDGASTMAKPIFPASHSESVLSTLMPNIAADASWYGDQPLTTDYASLRDFVTVGCATSRDHHYLAVTIHGDPTDPRADDVVGDLGPNWGLHVLDMSLVLGDVAELMAKQAEAYRNR